MIAFIIWTAVALIFVIIGIISWKSRKAVGFFSNLPAPEIPEDNLTAYNHSVAIIWFIFSAVFELFGIPLLIFEQNSPFFLIILPVVFLLIIAICIAYINVEKKFK